MANPSTIPQILSVPNPGLKDLLDALKQDIMRDLNCHGIATVQSFSQADNGKFVIQATMNYQKTYWQPQPSGSYIPQLVSYPILVDCPAIVLGGGSTALTFPIQAGDQCLIMFNDRDIQNWFAGAQSGPVATPRCHSFADAIAFVGFQTVESYDSTHAIITNAAGAKVGVQASGDLCLISNNSGSLRDVLLELVSVLNTFAGALGAASDPVVSTAADALTAAFPTVSSEIKALLE